MNMYVCDLLPYLAHNLEAHTKGLAERSALFDCLWGELCGSINCAEFDDGTLRRMSRRNTCATSIFGGKDV